MNTRNNRNTIGNILMLNGFTDRHGTHIMPDTVGQMGAIMKAQLRCQPKATRFGSKDKRAASGFVAPKSWEK